MEQKEHYLSLQHSESVVANMAATIFAAYVQSKDSATLNEDALIAKSVEIAIKIAEHTDREVKSDEEWTRR